MANDATTGPVSLFINKVKVAECTGGSFNVDPKVTQTPTNDGMVYGLGKTTSSLKWKTAVPRRGMRARLMEAVVAKQEVVANFVLDSKSYEISGRMSAGGVNWEVANGTLDGDWEMIAGEPKIS